MPLNILQVATAFPSWGGTELHLLNLSRQLSTRGHNVVVACMPGKWVEGRAKEWGIETAPFTVARQHDWSALGSLRGFIRERKFDVVHAHWNSDLLVPATAAMLEGVPVRILSRHSPNPFRSQIGGWFFGKHLYSKIITVSESVRRTMIASGVPQDRVLTIHHGTNIPEFDLITVDPVNIRKELGILETDIAVVLAGRIAEEKGHADLISAANLIGNDLPLKYIIVGEGPIEAEVKQLVAASPLSDRFVFAGFRSDMSNLLNAMDIVCVPSIWEEPCSAVIQQGMVMRKPVIGTKVGGTPEMILDGQTGIVIEPKNPVAFAGALRCLASDAALRETMGNAGRERVEAEFSLKVMTDKVERLYLDQLNLSRSKSFREGQSQADSTTKSETPA